MMKRRDEAIVEYNEALKCRPANWVYWRSLAVLHESTEAYRSRPDWPIPKRSI